ncbi:ribosome-binding factor A [Novosphingobium sp. PhB165]|uniref:30S ribosome-binding factor RbfA n=1 Tax=Novosphingobium sp. PhB165 TaxID=2485105 RepID=UPI0010458A4C|nr:30S ribosome-binding factor RbfA [Novosphingobium sp. PhB165]TCM17926.1 ribosome-binding factor A [Novosphingobium sp. PhB165]
MARQQITPEQHSVRLLKVGEQVRHIISEILSRQQVHDQTLSGHLVSVTEVRMTPDLRQATVFVKPLLGVDEEEVLKALRTNTAFFQREVAQRLKLRSAAKIRFRQDETFEEASRIDALLSDPRVKRDLDAAGSDPIDEEE